MSTSRVAIYTALAADLAIAAIKFVAAAVTHSSGMLSEGVHSLIDSINEVMLLIGIRQSKKPADEVRPFGYGKELYFWSFIVSVLLFCLGGIYSFYQGILHLRHPVPLENLHWNYFVLGAAFVFNALSIIPPFRIFNKERGSKSLWMAVKHSKDPSTFVVLLEDAGGLIGIVIAFAGVWLGHVFDNPLFDSVASLAIGLILMAISIVLTIESRSLLMGEAASKKILKEVIRITESDPAVVKVIRHFSMHLAPEEIVLQLMTAFREDLTTHELTDAIERIEKKIREAVPIARQIYIQPESIKHDISQKVNRRTQKPGT